MRSKKSQVGIADVFAGAGAEESFVIDQTGAEAAMEMVPKLRFHEDGYPLAVKNLSNPFGFDHSVKAPAKHAIAYAAITKKKDFPVSSINIPSSPEELKRPGRNTQLGAIPLTANGYTDINKKAFKVRYLAFEDSKLRIYELPSQKRGMGKSRNQGNNGVSGKIKSAINNLHFTEGEGLDPTLYGRKILSSHLQRLAAIRVLKRDSSSVQLVFLRPRKKSSKSRGFTLRRGGRKDHIASRSRGGPSMLIKAPSRQFSSVSNTSFMRSNTNLNMSQLGQTMSPIERNKFTPNRKTGGRNGIMSTLTRKLRPKRGSRGSAAQYHPGHISTQARKFSNASFESMGSKTSFFSTVARSEAVIDLGGMGTNELAMNSLYVKDDDGKLSLIEQDVCEIHFVSSEACKSWISFLLTQLENVGNKMEEFAKFYMDQYNSFAVQQENSIDLAQAEVHLRSAVDILTLVKGTRHERVWKVRDLLAHLLEKKSEGEESQFWYQHSHYLRLDKKLNPYEVWKTSARPTRSVDLGSINIRAKQQKPARFTVIPRSRARGVSDSDYNNWFGKKPQGRDQAFQLLVSFLMSLPGSGDHRACTQVAESIFEDNLRDVVNVANAVELRFGKVPFGFEPFLMKVQRSPLQEIRSDISFEREFL